MSWKSVNLFLIFLLFSTIVIGDKLDSDTSSITITTTNPPPTPPSSGGGSSNNYVPPVNITVVIPPIIENVTELYPPTDYVKEVEEVTPTLDDVVPVEVLVIQPEVNETQEVIIDQTHFSFLGILLALIVGLILGIIGRVVTVVIKNQRGL